MSPTEIKQIMEKYDIAPKKLFGQNFLISEGILEKIIKEANLSKDDVILEVGPGLGALTLKMAPHVKKIIAVEKDRELVKILTERLKEQGISNVQIIEEDILKFNPTDHRLMANDYKLIANIPYYLTSALIRDFLESQNKPQKIILMIQKEVAQRICAPKYDEKMNILALSVQFYAEARVLFYVSKANFWPAPKIDSAVIEIIPLKKLPEIDEKMFFRVVKAGFANKRKQLASNLANNLNVPKEKIEEILENIGLNPRQRAEELALEQWFNLINRLGSSHII